MIRRTGAQRTRRKHEGHNISEAAETRRTQRVILLKAYVF
jgi:hypothetical protein